jgi:RluA family pseudouridine synthase
MIIFEDEDFIALNKPSGMLAIPDRFDEKKENLYALLTEKFGKIWIVHRLDKDTSGVIVFAKTPEAHRDLSMKWEEGEVSKRYNALLTGEPKEEKGKIRLAIAPLKKKKGVMVVDKKRGKKSITNYKIIEKFKGYTLVEAVPKTGRTHQLRVHFAYIGCPIAGDTLYNRPEAMKESGVRNPGSGVKEKSKISNLKSKIEFDRLMLHAISLSFIHYRKGEPVELEAPIPESMKTAITKLRLLGLVGG